jgi:hypothetical protein
MSHKKTYRLLLFVGLLLSTRCASAQNPETIIKVQAMDMARAVLAKDVDKLVQYIPPKLVEQAGGKEKMMQARDTVNKYMQQFGPTIKRITIGNPGKIIAYKNLLQAMLPQTTELKFMASTIIMETTLIALSEDKGKHWYFIDTSIYRSDKLKTALPNLSPELDIPPMKPPKVIPDEQ